jgi:hypothetical protein
MQMDSVSFGMESSVKDDVFNDFDAVMSGWIKDKTCPVCGSADIVTTGINQKTQFKIIRYHYCEIFKGNCTLTLTYPKWRKKRLSRSLRIS